jgi:hypothetical protein
MTLYWTGILITFLLWALYECITTRKERSYLHKEIEAKARILDRLTRLGERP